MGKHIKKCKSYVCRVTAIIIAVLVCVVSVKNYPAEAGENSFECYIATASCPDAYIEYAEENISDFILSLYDADLDYSDIFVGTPFAFAREDADIYYFPVICGGSIEYIFRVYPDGDSFSAAISEFLAAEINSLAAYTSPEDPMYLTMDGAAITARIADEEYILFEYPSYLFDETEASSVLSYDYEIINAGDNIGFSLTLRQTRDVYEYITLDITEIQTSDNWCVAYCLAAIIRTQTNYTPVAKSLMTIAIGSNPSSSATFPWNKIDSVASRYGLDPTVLTTTASNAVLIAELNAGRPCIVAMYNTTGTSTMDHAVVLRGYSSLGTWSIWNPWYSVYENYSMTGIYVPYSKDAEDYSYLPDMHAYGFG